MGDAVGIRSCVQDEDNAQVDVSLAQRRSVVNTDT